MIDNLIMFGWGVGLASFFWITVCVIMRRREVPEKYAFIDARGTQEFFSIEVERLTREMAKLNSMYMTSRAQVKDLEALLLRERNYTGE